MIQLLSRARDAHGSVATVAIIFDHPAPHRLGFRCDEAEARGHSEVSQSLYHKFARARSAFRNSAGPLTEAHWSDPGHRVAQRLEQIFVRVAEHLIPHEARQARTTGG